jgi:hypothetical protein
MPSKVPVPLIIAHPTRGQSHFLRYIKSAPIIRPSRPKQKATGAASLGAISMAQMAAITPGTRAGSVMPICGTGSSSK